MNPTEQYLAKSRAIIETVAAQQSSIQQVADLFATTILAGKMVHVFGSGHSRMMTEEMWPRYGSFPGFDYTFRTTSRNAGLSLSLRGTCPGTITLAWSGATPNKTMGIAFANTTGSFVIPGGPCGGTQLGLSSSGLQLVNTISTGSGSGTVNGNAGTAACSHYLQLVVVDASPCTTSNVAQIN